MVITSMTGFARAAGNDSGAEWIWEARSVNAKGLDVRVRVPQGWSAIENVCREAAAKRFSRGTINLSLQVSQLEGQSAFQVNEQALAHILALQSRLAGQVSEAKPTIEGLLAVRGVIELVEPTETEEILKAREGHILKGLERALADLSEGRASEGTQLAKVLRQLLDDIAAHVEDAARLAAEQPVKRHARLVAQLSELLQDRTDLPEDRLMQEVALLVSKGDIREELDRLDAHVAAARAMLLEGGAIGRRLDFLCQEFNRETNTICAKANDLAMTRIGLALKSLIEQLREQVQNIA